MATRSMRHQPFTIYDDFQPRAPFENNHEGRMSTSPSPYDADNGLSSDDCDSVLPSVEAHPGVRKSSAAFTSISSIPPSLPYDSDISPYTPRKGARPAFRSPSSVRAMQMSSPPPFQSPHNLRIGSPFSGRKARRDTPGSIRSGSVLHNVHPPMEYEEQSIASNDHGSGRGTPSIQHQPSPARGPLVLLHATVLPSPGLPYSIESLQELAPSFVLQNWYLLQEQLTETVLSRGLLIPHPGEDFDLLEEGLLETLGLCAPRIGSCGHFFSEDPASDSDSGHDSGVADVGGRDREQLTVLSQKSLRLSTPSSSVRDTCHDCERPIRSPGKGIGSGNARWEVKVYASNGLMRAGAWFAAYKEMERVDVEIEPWIPEDVRRALDLRLEQEQEHMRKEHEELEKLRFDLEVMERLRSDADDERARAEQRARDLEQDLEAARAAVPPLLPAVLATPPIKEELDVPKKRDTPNTPHNWTVPEPARHVNSEDIPISTLLRNYVVLLAQDRRNVALGVLSVLVILLSLRIGSPRSLQAAAVPSLADTMRTQLGNTILADTQWSTSLERHTPDNTDPLTQSIMSSPIVDASIASSLARGQDRLPIPPVASSVRASEAASVDSPLARSKKEEEGAAAASHSSVHVESGGKWEPGAFGATSTPSAQSLSDERSN